MHSNPQQFAQQADAAAEFLRTLGNAHRLQILCLLAGEGSLSVGQIQQHTTLSQSALSQHLAKMRDEGLITYRREAQTLYYSIGDDRVWRMLEALQAIFCPPDESD